MELQDWEPGHEGKGILYVTDTEPGHRVLRIWKTDADGAPFHAQGIEILGLADTQVLVCIAVSAEREVTEYRLGGPSYLDQIYKADERLSPAYPFRFGVEEEAGAEDLSNLASDAFRVQLQDAVGGAMNLASQLRLAPPLLGTLQSAASFLLLQDPSVRRIGRASALNALAQFATLVNGRHPGWPAQRERQGPWLHPPYDRQANAIERKITEGLTEYLTGRILEQARLDWTGKGFDHIAVEEPYRSSYRGYRLVCLAAARLARPNDEDLLPFLRHVSHNPHKLTIFTEAYTGEYTAERKQALADVFALLLAEAEAADVRAGQSDEAMLDLATEALGAYIAKHD